MTFSEAVKILGLGVAASKKDIRNAYRGLVVKNHPDKFQDEMDKKVAEKNFKRIQEAYDFLNDLQPAINVGDRTERSVYDQDTDSVKTELDEILKMTPMSESGFNWSSVSSVQDQILKMLIMIIPFFVLAAILFLFWEPMLKWVKNLF